MKWENIKKGDRVLIPAVVDREPDGEYLYVSFKCGGGRNGLEYFRRADMSKYLILPPENGIKNTESASKYDPCRMFKKGDRVEVVKYKGRNGSMDTPVATLAVVIEDEDEDAWIYIQAEGSNKIDTIDPAYLELVTPVEALEPYGLCSHTDGECVDWHVTEKDGFICMSFHARPHGAYTPSTAREAAEAERDRLNAAYRREMGK